MSYTVGKLPNSVLAKLLSGTEHRVKDSRVLVGPRVGEDAAILDFGETCLVVSTDPITLATKNPGWYAVHVNANDVAVRGARPRWFSAVLLLPEEATDEVLVSSIFSEIYEACVTLGCTLIGGHTEISAGLSRPIIVGQMLGEVERKKLVTSAGCKVGDALLLTKGIAIEGTALLAREKANELSARGLSDEWLGRAQNLLFAPGISVVRDALLANSSFEIHAMHDPTEGGLATALAELAEASQVGLVVEKARIPLLPACERICNILELDPLGLLASGSLLLAVAQDDAERVTQFLSREGIASARIGEIVSREADLRLKTANGAGALPTFERDEITKVL